MQVILCHRQDPNLEHKRSLVGEYADLLNLEIYQKNQNRGIQQRQERKTTGLVLLWETKKTNDHEFMLEFVKIRKRKN